MKAFLKSYDPDYPGVKTFVEFEGVRLNQGDLLVWKDGGYAIIREGGSVEPIETVREDPGTRADTP